MAGKGIVSEIPTPFETISKIFTLMGKKLSPDGGFLSIDTLSLDYYYFMVGLGKSERRRALKGDVSKGPVMYALKTYMSSLKKATKDLSSGKIEFGTYSGHFYDNIQTISSLLTKITFDLEGTFDPTIKDKLDVEPHKPSHKTEIKYSTMKLTPSEWEYFKSTFEKNGFIEQSSGGFSREITEKKFPTNFPQLENILKAIDYVQTIQRTNYYLDEQRNDATNAVADYFITLMDEHLGIKPTPKELSIDLSVQEKANIKNEDEHAIVGVNVAYSKKLEENVKLGFSMDDTLLKYVHDGTDHVFSESSIGCPVFYMKIKKKEFPDLQNVYKNFEELQKGENHFNLEDFHDEARDVSILSLKPNNYLKAMNETKMNEIKAYFVLFYNLLQGRKPSESPTADEFFSISSTDK